MKKSKFEPAVGKFTNSCAENCKLPLSDGNDKLVYKYDIEVILLSKSKKAVLIVLCALIVLGAVCLGVIYKLYKDQNPTVLELKDKLKVFICDIKISRLKDENEGIVPRSTLFDDGAKKVIETDSGVRLIHYASGYYIDLPEGTEFDFSCSPDFVKASCADFSVTISREYSSEPDVRGYVSYYLDRFLLDEGCRESNKIELLDAKHEENGRDRFSARLSGYDGGWDAYTYSNIYTDTKIYYRLTFKFNGDDFETTAPSVNAAIDSLTYFRPKGDDKYTVAFKNLGAHGLSDEAMSVYSDLENTKSIYWGLFTSNIYDEGIDKTVPEYERKLDYNFSIILAYLHFGDEFPTEFAEKCFSEGKILELTYQPTVSNNENLTGYTPQLDIYRGLYDDEIRSFAAAAAEFGHPFLFRFGNEMNSDWTSYSGILNMSDPELYIEVWHRIYNIFVEEGATNAIWVYNPNDRECPPCGWNNFLAYYPGDEYVHIIGVTGYNNGTYYKETYNEVWREFKAIYDVIEKKYKPFFSDFPWIITEFSSSSIGGDKAKWITDMFKDIYSYENIKAAVWFDYADFDPAYENNSVVSRPYWLCENEEITETVKNGFAAQEQCVWSFMET